MSNEITLFKSGAALPDYLREPDEFTRRLAGGGAAVKSISIEGGVWRMMEGSNELAKNEERAMNFIIVNAAENVARTYYQGAYVKGAASAPVCFSPDGKTPDISVKTPQSANCQTCQQNVKGSGQGDSRACRYSQRFAVVLEGDIGGAVYRLQLPAKSLFGKADGDKMPLQAYAKFLAGHGVPISGVVTEARFDTSESVPVLKFRAVRPLTREEVATSRAQGTSEDAALAVEFTVVVSKEGAKEASPQPALYQEPEAAPAPAAAEPAAEPTKRQSKKPDAVPTPPKNVAEIIGDWADDDEERSEEHTSELQSR